MEILDLYDNNFKKLNKTIVRRIDEIPKDTNIMLSYTIIKNGDKYLLEQTTSRNGYGALLVVICNIMKMI